MNAILAYALAALVSEISTDFEFTTARGRNTTLHGWAYQRFFVPHVSPVNASLAFAIFFVVCNICAAVAVVSLESFCAHLSGAGLQPAAFVLGRGEASQAVECQVVFFNLP